MFEDLLGELRRVGFTVGPSEHLRLHKLLAQLQPDTDPGLLGNLVCPIFAKNAEQQQTFRNAFRRYEHLFSEVGEAPASKPQITEPVRRSGTLFRMVPSLAISGIILALLWLGASRLDTSSTSSEQPASQTQTTGGTGGGAATGGAPVPVVAPAPNTRPPSAPKPSFGMSGRVWASLVCLTIYLLLEFRYYRLRRLALRRERGREGPWTWSIQPAATQHGLFNYPEFFQIAKRLRGRETGEVVRLDLPATVQATTKSGGLTRFAWRFLTKSPEYLALVDRASSRDHLARYFTELITALRAEGLYIRLYYFDADPRACVSEDGLETVFLRDLSEKYAGYRLLLLSDGHRMADPVTGRLAAWTHLFERWQLRAVVTPVDQRQWGATEEALAGCFDVRAATAHQLLSLAEDWESPAGGAPRWSGPVRSGKGDRNPAMNGQKSVADASHLWLCGCAVYPELLWDLTLRLATLPALGTSAARSEREGAMLSMFCHPWFRHGWIPDEARERLIGELDPTTEREVREKILALLESAPAPPAGHARQQRDWQITVQRFWLDSRDPKNVQAAREQLRRDPRRSERRDFTTLRVLEALPFSKLLFALPTSFRRVFFPRGLPLFGVRPFIRLVLLVLSLGIVWQDALPSFSKFKSRDELNAGVVAFKNAQYAEAVNHFQKAAELDPESSTARLYLATAYMTQYIPGADSPENNRMADAAANQFIRVLKQKPNDVVALSSLGSLYYSQASSLQGAAKTAKLDQAAQWYEKVVIADPNNKEAYYTLGVVAWSKWYPAYSEARAKIGMKPEDPGPLRNVKVRDQLRAQWLPVIDAGIDNLKKAIQVDPEYDDAMAYTNLLIRERADLEDTAAGYKKAIDEADGWIQKTLDTKKAKASRLSQQSGGIQEPK